MKKDDGRINKILEILLEYTQKDFSLTIPISEKRDELDAIAVGLNTMAEELNVFITERKIQEKKLRRSNELFSSLFERNPASLAISRIRDTRIINVNDSFIQLFGFTSKEEVIGRTMAELNVWVDPAQREEMMQLLKAGRQALTIEEQIRTRQGEMKWASTSVLIIDIDNDPCLLAVTLDTTHRKKAEEQLQSLNQELEAFTYSVSHDLRAPLRAVNGYAQMLMEDHGGQLDNEGKRIIETIRYNALKMGTLIDELLAFSRLGRKEAHKRDVDMEQLVKGVLLEISKLIPHTATIKFGHLHNVQGEYGLLHQVMFNLVANAVKYSSKQKNPVVEIFSEDQIDEILYGVRDNGAGFDMRYVDKLFGVFQRLHTEHEFEGTGVGLAIVKRVITKHGGKVWAEGKKNEGATFYFTLPKK
jgi:PAS domain S-box-containing protein